MEYALSTGFPLPVIIKTCLQEARKTMQQVQSTCLPITVT